MQSFQMNTFPETFCKTPRVLYIPVIPKWNAGIQRFSTAQNTCTDPMTYRIELVSPHCTSRSSGYGNYNPEFPANFIHILWSFADDSESCIPMIPTCWIVRISMSLWQKRHSFINHTNTSIISLPGLHSSSVLYGWSTSLIWYEA